MSDQLLSAKIGDRLFFVDHLRVALTILVVLHHLAIVYGATTPFFYYVEPPYDSSGDVDGLTHLLLLVFILFNQGYFMGVFFLIAGYFTPGTFDRKGPRAFLKDRLIRLGIPLLAFTFVLGPVASIGTYEMPVELTHITEPFSWRHYPNLVGMGPLWFAAMLLVFAFGYAGWRLATPRRAPLTNSKPTPPGHLAIGGFVLALALASYTVRIAIPLGGAQVLGFPTLSYLPQYVSFFAVGTVAYRRDWFRTIPGSLGKAGTRIALLSTIVLFVPALFIGGGSFGGRGSLCSAVYALWDSAFSVGMALGLLVFFRARFGQQRSLGRFLSRHAFTVYIVHTPVIVLLALALRGFQPEHLLKFAVVAIIGVPLCFAVAYLVRRIPLASQVL